MTGVKGGVHTLLRFFGCSCSWFCSPFFFFFLSSSVSFGRFVFFPLSLSLCLFAPFCQAWCDTSNKIVTDHITEDVRACRQTNLSLPLPRLSSLTVVGPHIFLLSPHTAPPHATTPYIYTKNPKLYPTYLPAFSADHTTRGGHPATAISPWWWSDYVT